MEILYRTKDLQKLCTNISYAQRKLGDKSAILLHQRIDEISAASSIEEMVKYKIGRCHQLTGDRKNQFALDLSHPYRLIIIKVDVTTMSVKIVEITDYH